MNTYKRIIPCIYLLNQKAVKGFGDRSIVSENPVELARFYGENNADELIVFDLSVTDAEHENAILMIKQMAQESQIPLTGAGNIKRMEDVKKLLYAGCRKALLNYSKEEDIALTREVSLKFGR